MKNIVIFYVEFKKNNSFLIFHSPIFYSKIHKHFACKMNRDEQGGGAGQKLEFSSEHTF